MATNSTLDSFFGIQSKNDTQKLNLSQDVASARLDAYFGTKTPAKGTPNLSRAQEAQSILDNASNPETNGSDTRNQGVIDTQTGKAGALGKLITGGESGQDIGQAVYSGFQAVKGALGGHNRIAEAQQGYIDNGNKLLELANKQTDPALKMKYSKMASEMFSDAGKSTEGILGNVRSTEQVAGDFAGLGANLAAGGGALNGLGAGLGKTASAGIENPILQGAVKGAIPGAIQGGAFGAVQGGAEQAQNNGSLGQVAAGTALGGAGGATVGGVIGGATGAIPEIKQTLKEKRLQANQAKLEEVISPKPTVKEARLAMSEGRLVKGNEPGWFTKGTADQVISSDKVMNNAPIIEKNIPGAAKMSPDVLADEIKMKIGDISQELKPQMQKVPVHPDVIEEAPGVWEGIKQAQIEEDVTGVVNIEKIQSKFESLLNKTLGKENLTLDDVWQARQAYDDSIKDAVKKANSMSPEALQAQKDLWLENRKFLNAIINDSVNGLGKTSKNAFSDMTAMYDARNNIISKAKISTTAAPSKVSQFLKNHKTAIEIVGGGTILGTGLPTKIAKKVTGQ